MATLIIKQPVLHRITDEEVLEALPEEVRSGIRPIVEIDAMAAAQQAIDSEDWSGAATQLIQQYTAGLKPKLDAYPSARLAYFGTAPIPLALQLGALVGSWNATEMDTYLRHHESGKWAWPAVPPGATPQVHVEGMPKDMVPTEGEAIIRVSTSAKINPQDTLAVVADPLVQVDIWIEPMGLDAVVSMTLLDQIAADFRKALDAISNLRPGAGTVHVFASVPVGLAFRLGTRISPTSMHPRVQTYQFHKTAEVHYQRAILLNEEVRAPIVLSDEARTRAAEVREVFIQQAKRLRALAGSYRDWAQPQERPNWIDFVLPIPAASAKLKMPPWTELPTFSPELRSNATIDPEVTTVRDGFCFDRTKGTWQLGDDLLAAIARGAPKAEDQARIARLLLLHECAHERHNLTTATSPEVGLFPKILEEIDYQADVWAMLHAYRMARNDDPDIDPRTFCLEAMQIGTQGMWAFDAGDTPLHEIQVRRLNRYLLLYWQYLRLERVRPGDLAGVAGVLASRPLIELTGPKVLPRRDSRVYYQLDPRYVHQPELAVLHDNRIHRLGATRSLRLDDLLESVRNRNGERIKEILRGAFDQLQRTGDGR